jgi:hypothetical protein
MHSPSLVIRDRGFIFPDFLEKGGEMGFQKVSKIQGSYFGAAIKF